MPGPVRARLPAALAAEIVAAARAALPNEAVGLLVGPTSFADGGSPTRYISMANSLASPYRYAIDPQEQLRVWTQLEDSGEVVWAIVHSHVSAPAAPSATDIEQAYFPDSLHMICSLADPQQPVTSTWSIRDGAATEVPLAIIP